MSILLVAGEGEEEMKHLATLQLCTGCDKPLSAKEIEHGLEGFGHQGVCCDCYDQSMREGKPTKRKAAP